MMITNKFKLDLQNPGTVPIINAVQNDSYSRNLEIALFSGRQPFVFPETGRVVIRYKKSDGKGGEYDTLPDGRCAWQWVRNLLTVTLAPQVLTTPGSVLLSVTLLHGETQLSVFPIRLTVQPIAAASQAASEDYFYITGLLPAPVSGNVGQSLRIAAVNEAGRITAVEAADSVTPQKGVDYWTQEDQKSIVRDVVEELNTSAIDPTVYGLPVLYLAGNTAGMSKDNAVALDYVYGEHSGTASVKWQGSSSIVYPKKNYTIKFDNAFEAAEGWGEQKKYCLKANYIDHSHARNIVSAKLWGEIVKSRENTNTKLSALPNGGAVDGFPCIIMLNGDFHGLYTFNIPKDGWMFGMGNNTQMTVRETFGFDSWIVFDSFNQLTGEYTPTDSVTTQFVTQRSPAIGGRAYCTWDNQKIAEIAVRAHIFDTTDTPIKVFGLSAEYYGKSGDFGADALKEPGNIEYFWAIDSFSIPIPPDCYVIWEIWVPNSTDRPDGTLTNVWTEETQANGTWIYEWVKTGIEYSIVSASDAKECILCANNHSAATRFEASALCDESDFEIEYITDETDTAWAVASVNKLISAVMSSNGTDIDSTIGKYLDIQSAIDFYIFTALQSGQDNVDKNYILATYDGVKWFFSTYDMDSTFGNDWTGKYYISTQSYPTLLNFGNKVIQLVRDYKTAEVKTRYRQLRSTVLSEDNVLLKFENFMAGIPSALYEQDTKLWPLIPGTKTNNIAQIANFYRLRVQLLDAQAEEM